MKFSAKHLSKFSPHLKCVPTLPCEMKIFENDTNGAQITIKCYNVTHMFSQLMTLSLNLLKIFLLELHISSQMHVPLVN